MLNIATFTHELVQTLGFFFKDLVKKTVVSQLITLPLLALTIYIIQIGGEHFYIYAWLMVFTFSMVRLYDFNLY